MTTSILLSLGDPLDAVQADFVRETTNCDQPVDNKRRVAGVGAKKLGTSTQISCESQKAASEAICEFLRIRTTFRSLNLYERVIALKASPGGTRLEQNSAM